MKQNLATQFQNNKNIVKVWLAIAEQGKTVNAVSQRTYRWFFKLQKN